MQGLCITGLLLVGKMVIYLLEIQVGISPSMWQLRWLAATGSLMI